MKAMLLAAGLGTRLGRLTERIPKCLVDVGGMSVLERNVRWLGGYGITELVVNTHAHADAVRSQLGDGRGLGVRVTYSHEETLLGTAGAVRAAARFLDDGDFLLVYADNVFGIDLHRLIATHQRADDVVTIALLHRPDVTASGLVMLDGSDRVVEFHEKPARSPAAGGWVNAGLLVCDPRLRDLIPDGASDLGRDVIPRLVAAGEIVRGHRLAADEWVRWIDTPADLQRTRESFERPP